LGDEREQRDTAAALASARGLIRSEVGRQLGLRLTPTLEFTTDAVPATAAELERALQEAAQRDAELARLSAGARHAGDPDPYRRPTAAEEETDDDAGDAGCAADVSSARLAPLGVGVGVLAGPLGIGGGVVLVPLLVPLPGERQEYAPAPPRGGIPLPAA